MAHHDQNARAIETVATATVTTAATIPEPSVASISRLTLTAATTCVLTFPTAAAGKSFTLVTIQPAGAGTGLVTVPASVKWAGGTTPTLTATAAKRDVFTFLCADGTNWLGFTAPCSSRYREVYSGLFLNDTFTPSIVMPLLGSPIKYPDFFISSSIGCGLLVNPYIGDRAS